ncbi:thiamine phosphate synthase [Nocardioides pocheonensis]|uniref:Thiamine phosphate synthase n=1 Tax=Nocardioides pocheonensis TaxID=661485 RepID=A0A3N0GI98_9ACTN|nr:thiamine phosphate synthase [Nocardioides pocheonensis]RNM12151.1 thiamine phosphate synthase [Nocardioides pocheonensis]
MTSAALPDRLLLLTDRSQLPEGADLVEVVRSCASAGLTQVVVRELDLDPPDRQRLVAELSAVAGLTVLAARTPLAGASGVHLAAGQQRPAVDWFGRSCHDVAAVRRASEEGAAYVTLSPFAASTSKPGYGPPVSGEAYAIDHDIPVFALGGVGPGNAAAARAAGAFGVAVMGCVMRASDPAGVVRELMREVGG